MNSGKKSLPINSDDWQSEDEYVQSLLRFVTTSDIFHNLCGGVHVLDFLTREPDLYTTVLPQEWREWFDLVSIDDVLELLLRLDIKGLQKQPRETTDSFDTLPSPPQSLLDYISTVRKHLLGRDFSPVADDISELPRHVAVGMKPKKIHEVVNFAAYVGELSADVSARFDAPVAVVDFGSGQNYLGRTLAGPPYRKHVVAIERKHHNIDGARSMDVHARLAKKEKVMRNKKEWKRQLALAEEDENEGVSSPVSADVEESQVVSVPDVVLEQLEASGETPLDATNGSMTYVEHDITDGHLEHILYPSTQAQADGTDNTTSRPDPPPPPPPAEPNTKMAQPKAMVISLHSCGNLLHHGLRSLILNPSVCAVAMIGCCYNLLTERLGPATYKLPQLRPNHPRLEATGNTFDPHGFPMSRTLETFAPSGAEQGTAPTSTSRGVRLNITARMMAVQAPYNWGAEDSEAFFRRHFYRALLQRMLLDVGVVQQCADPGGLGAGTGGSVTGRDASGTPLIVGTLRKACFASFRAYVHGALEKLRRDPVDGALVAEKTRALDDDAVIDAYETRWGFAKKHLAVIWSLMAFSAGVVESVIVVDRWLFLREQDCVERCWVESVFDYRHSPRNLVVVGIKKTGVEGGRGWEENGHIKEVQLARDEVA
ncbi:hypothetical protein LTR84_012341 [Exophiala bonariae]|uniref:Methyltransferase domain-containing protein n=1 Tax=Exophiala bonariae TaxID=1690606 RepID=A0AAV9NH04_9EURO|nr:hypothetical protein LTR84_012341 [Exophiala bonariae]